MSGDDDGETNTPGWIKATTWVTTIAAVGAVAFSLWGVVLQNTAATDEAIRTERRDAYVALLTQNQVALNSMDSLNTTTSLNLVPPAEGSCDASIVQARYEQLKQGFAFIDGIEFQTVKLMGPTDVHSQLDVVWGGAERVLATAEPGQSQGTDCNDYIQANREAFDDYLVESTLLRLEMTIALDYD